MVRKTPRTASSTTRTLLRVAGTVCLVLGLVGLVLPVVPTVPFILLAAACFARSSERLHRKLLNDRFFGRTVREWELHHRLPYATKATGLAFLVVGLSISIVFFVRPLWLQVALALVGLAFAAWIACIPSAPAR